MLFDVSIFYFFQGTAKKEYIAMGKSPYMRVDRGWIKIGGDFKIQDRGMPIFVQVDLDA